MQGVFEKIKQRIIIAATEAYGYTPMTRVVSEAELKEILEKVEEEYGDGWIPCSKRLPEPNDFPEQNHRILASCTDGIVRNATIKSLLEAEEHHSRNGAFFYEAWRPLPESYKESEE